MSGNTKDTTALILAAMDDLGPADARTIAEKADVGYSTAVRKLREWSTNGEITKIDRGSDSAHYALLPTDQPLPDHLQPAHLPTPAGALFDDIDDGDIDQAQQPIDGGQQAATGEPATEVEAPSDDAHTRATDDIADDIATKDDDLEAEDAASVVPDGGALEAPAQEDGEQDQGELLTDAAIEAGEQPEEADTPEGHSQDEPDQAPPADLASGGQYAEDTPTALEPEADAAPQPTPDVTAAAGAAPRRPKGYFHTESMAILRANPDTAYTVGDVAKLILAKEIDTGAPATTQVSSGAISNALFKAAGAGECLVVKEKDPAMFQAA
ncbi:hypothetical protein ACLQ24_00240 [Micromonospora sp. DT4]|uniref:hypothetical protein n=1 Tax=Micromonospora sp. DT4 TaxID=3393438 RepID=UPI003CF184EB